MTIDAVTEAYADVLGAAVGPDTSLFEAGGSSLAAARIAVALRRAGLPVTTRAVLVHPTPRALAGALSGAGPDPAPARSRWPVGDGGPAPASVQQQVIWFLEQLHPGNVAYNTAVTVRLDGPVDEDRLRAAVGTLLARHEVLRTGIGTLDGELVQRPAEDVAPVFRVLDCTEADVAGQVLRAARTRFDTARPPLLEWTLLRLGPERRVLVQVEHHFVHDGWSMWLLLTDLAAAYRGTPGPPPAEHGYRRFARWQRSWLGGAEAARQRRWWAETLAGCTAPVRFPRDADRPAEFDHRGGTVEAPLPAEVAAAVRTLSVRLGVTPFAVLMAAFAALTGAHTGTGTYALGSMLRNRPTEESDGVVGMFVNTIALPVRDWPAATYRELTRRTAALLAAAEDVQEVPFPEVVAELGGGGQDLSRNAVFQVSFSFNDWPEPELDLGPGIAAEVRFPTNGGSKFDLDVVVLPDRDGWRLLWRYYAGVLDPAEVGLLVARYGELLCRLAADPDAVLGPLLAGASR